MKMIHLKLFSILAELAGFRDFEFETRKVISFFDFLSILFEKTPKKFKDYIYNEEKELLKGSITIVVNEKVFDEKEIYALELKNGDIIAILTPIEGG